MTGPSPALGWHFDDLPSGPGQQPATTVSLDELTELVDVLDRVGVPGDCVQVEAVVRVRVPHDTDRTLSAVRCRNASGPYWLVRLSWADVQWTSLDPMEAAAFVAAALLSEQERTSGHQRGDGADGDDVPVRVVMPRRPDAAPERGEPT